MSDKIQVDIRYEGEDGKLHEKRYGSNELRSFHYMESRVQGNQHMVVLVLAVDCKEERTYLDRFLPTKREFLAQHGIVLLKDGE